jgi:inner membrane transporter RhtA
MPSPRVPASPVTKAPVAAPGRVDRSQGPLAAVPPPVLLGIGMISVQVGAGLAGRLFGEVTAAGMTGLRLWAAALLMIGFGARAAVATVRRMVAERSWRDAAVVAGFGLTLGIMNYSIYQSFARIPLGIAVTIEFLGPLVVAIASSRRLIDLLWVGLAATGVALLGVGGVNLARLGSATVAGGRSQIAAGVAFALVAAAAWACYILLSASTGRRFAGSSGLAIAMVIASIAVTPAAVLTAGRVLLRPAVLAAGLVIGLASSVIPYRAELETLRRVPPRVFGIWMSLEPAIAALIGLLMLSQALSWPQWLAICCVIIASAGAALGAGRSAQVPQV